METWKLQLLVMHVEIDFCKLNEATFLGRNITHPGYGTSDSTWQYLSFYVQYNKLKSSTLWASNLSAI